MTLLKKIYKTLNGWILFFVLAIFIIVLYMFSYRCYNKKEGFNMDYSFQPFPNIKSNMITKMQTLGYDLSGLSDQYDKARKSLNQCITDYEDTFYKNNGSSSPSGQGSVTGDTQSGNSRPTTDFGQKIIDIFIKNANDIVLDPKLSGINTDTTDGLFKTQFGGTISDVSSNIMKGKDGTLDVIENGDTKKLSDLSMFGLLNYYQAKIYIITEWYFYYNNTPTIDVTSIKVVTSSTGGDVLAAYNKRVIDLKNAVNVSVDKSAALAKADGDLNGCDAHWKCPGRWDYKNGKSSEKDAATIKEALLRDGNPGDTKNYADLSLSDLKAKLDTVQAADKTQQASDTEKTNVSQAAAQNVYATYRKNALNDLPSLLSDILKNTAKQMTVINNTIATIKKLVDSFVASYKAKAMRITIIDAMYKQTANPVYDLDMTKLQQFVKAVAPRFFESGDSFDVTQIDDYTGNIIDSIDKMHILNRFNDAKNVQSGNTSTYSLMQQMFKFADTNKAFFEDPIAKSDKNFEQLKIYTYTFENANAIHFIVDLYYFDLLFVNEKIYDYIKIKLYQNADGSVLSSSSPGMDKLTLKADMNNFDAKIDGGNPNDSVLSSDIIKYSTAHLNFLLNIRNFLFMLFVRMGIMTEYVFDYSTYNQFLLDKGIPTDGLLHTKIEYMDALKKTNVYTDADIHYEMEKYIYILCKYNLTHIRDAYYTEYNSYTSDPQTLTNLSQGGRIYKTALQYISYIESSNKFTQNATLIYKDIFARYQDPATDPSNFPFKLTADNPVIVKNVKLHDECLLLRDEIKAYLYLPTYFGNGSLNGCYNDPKNSIFSQLFNTTNPSSSSSPFEISIVTRKTGAKSDPMLDQYGAVVNCINDTVAYNNVNDASYDTITLKPYNTDGAYHCYAGYENKKLQADLIQQNSVQPDISKCYISDDKNIAENTITYKVNPLKFDPVKDTLIFKGCYATSDVSNNIYNTIPHKIGDDLSQIVLTYPNDPNAAIKECQRRVKDENDKKRTNYDIFGITNDTEDTNLLYCYAGNVKFDANYAIDSRLARSDYTRGCNVIYPGPNNYMVFQDVSASLNSCKTESQIQLDKYNDLKTNWLNTNIKSQMDSLKVLDSQISDIDRRFPIQFKVSSTYLVKSGGSQPPNIKINNTDRSSPGISTPGGKPKSMNTCKLDLYLAQGPKGDDGGMGKQGGVGNAGKVGNDGLYGHDGYWGNH